MPQTLSLSDLDILDPAALKAMILDQHARARIQQEQLSSRTSEIERLILLVEKLQRMLFGTESEKMLRQIEQLELQLEELQAASAIEDIKATAPEAKPAPAKPFRRPPPEHLPREIHTTCRTTTPAPTAAASCANWAKMWPRCWNV
jgi:transposase